MTRMKIQLIRNATIRISYDDITILVDPYFAPKGSLDSLAGKFKNPMTNLPFGIEEILDGIDMVLISHLHTDHFDSVAQNSLSKDIRLFCQLEDESKIEEMGFENITPIADQVILQDLKITRTPGQHGYGEWAERLAPVSGFILESSSFPKIYWCGDTVLYPGVVETIQNSKPDIIITHSSGADFQGSGLILMDAEQTIETCKLAPNATVIATHMESLDHGTVSRKDIRELADSNGILEEYLLLPLDGEVISI